MREILFRGQTRRKGECAKTPNSNWVYGGIFIPDDNLNFAIIIARQESAVEKHSVYGDTVGQYTGLTDKNGSKIFEGDIIKSCEYGDIYAVKYFGDDNYPAFDCVPEVSNCECNGLSFLVNVEGCEVIGNIYDNPELLENNARKDKSI